MPDPAPDPMIETQSLDAPTAERLTPQLVALLQDAVESGASLGFWRPLSDDRAQAYWRTVIGEMAAGERRLLVVQRDGVVVGSVQLALATKQNAPHRAEVQKLMTLRAARRRGIARALMGAAERLALQERRTLLILDTNTGSDAERLYYALGYHRVGAIPGYTVESDGQEHATTLFYKSLGSLDAEQ
jgi:ribosomal protein S18 acetylase RimI-like enzyme